MAREPGVRAVVVPCMQPTTTAARTNTTSTTPDPVEVYEIVDGVGRERLVKNHFLAHLPSDAALPAVGDVIALPSSATGDSAAAAFIYHGMLAVFRVVEREHLYYSVDKPEGNSPVPYSKSWIYVRRLSQSEYLAPLALA